MKYCVRCGAPYDEYMTQFCGNCGMPVGTEVQQRKKGNGKIAAVTTMIAVAAVALVMLTVTACGAVPGMGAGGGAKRNEPEDVVRAVFEAACEDDPYALFDLYHPDHAEWLLEGYVTYESYDTKEEAKTEYCEHQRNRYYFNAMKGCDPSTLEITINGGSDHSGNLDMVGKYYNDFRHIDGEVNDVRTIDAKGVADLGDTSIELVVIEVDGEWYLLHI